MSTLNRETNKAKAPATNNLEQLKGSIERVTFHSEHTGFCVLQVKTKQQRELQTIVGNTAQVSAGEYIEAEGYWQRDPKFGLQFKAQAMHLIQPNSISGIEKYLASGMVPGIGPHFAKKLVATFGAEVFDIIEQQPERLLELEGFGPKRKQRLLHSWAEQKVVRSIMVFLQSHGIGSNRAVRIYKTYGDQAIAKVQANPYCLALDIHGIGFKTADQLAQKLGVPANSLIRAQAGVRHVLQTHSNSGHCAATQEQLVTLAQDILNIDNDIIAMAISEEIHAKRLVADTIDGEACIFLASLYHAERGIANQLQRLLDQTPPWGMVNVDKLIPWVEQHTQLTLSASQRQAVITVLCHKVSIITGGPGVGKTTIVNSILRILRKTHIRIALAAPTGRAAKRLTETTGREAKTLHRLLGIEPQASGFGRQKESLLKVDLLVIDEVSMIDVVLMNQVLQSLPDAAGLLLVGDVDQLPSVGPGAVLTDLIAAKAIPVVQLTEVFRQAANSQIITNAHKINRGEMIYSANHNNHTNKLSDFYFIATETPELIQEKILDLVTNRIPQRFGLNPITEIQVLTPTNQGGLGTRVLNGLLQEKLNPNAKPQVTRYGWTFAPGDKVIQTVNNYDKEVFNGDIGFITQVDPEESEIKADFEGNILTYGYSELDELALAYATTVHKSQGSEYPAIVLTLTMQHYMLLQRNFIYTGVTRGKQLVVVIGQKKAVAIAIKNINASKRLTKLKNHLQVIIES